MIDVEKINKAYDDDERLWLGDPEFEWEQVADDWEAGQINAGGKLKNYTNRLWHSSPEWLINDIIPCKGIGQLFGATGVGKTYFALSLAMAVSNASVKQWMGYDVDHHGVVVYVLMEGAYTFQNRVMAYVQNVSGTNDYELFT